MNNELIDARKNNGFTQVEAAKFLNVSLRSYKSYEIEKGKQDTIKYKYFVEQLNKNAFIDEEHGLLKVEKLIEIVKRILKDYDVDYCYLFGSYAKNKQKENSDVDLLISGNVTGLKFYGLVEKLREGLHKKVDLLDLKQLNNNQELLNEILKDGIKIYG